MWTIDAAVRGWTPLSAVTLAGLLLFTLGFGWLRYSESDQSREDLRTARTAA
jgi:hypothetical protein